MVFHRFEVDPEGLFRKNEDFVSYGQGLDVSAFLFPVLEKPAELELVNVIHHAGSLDFGHYTAYCKRENR